MKVLGYADDGIWIYLPKHETLIVELGEFNVADSKCQVEFAKS